MPISKRTMLNTINAQGHWQGILDDLVLAFTRTRAYWPALTRR